MPLETTISVVQVYINPQKLARFDVAALVVEHFIWTIDFFLIHPKCSFCLKIWLGPHKIVQVGLQNDKLWWRSELPPTKLEFSNLTLNFNGFSRRKTFSTNKSWRHALKLVIITWDFFFNELVYTWLDDPILTPWPLKADYYPPLLILPNTAELWGYYCYYLGLILFLSPTILYESY